MTHGARSSASGSRPPRPSTTAADQARARQATLTKPAGALGRLEDVSVWISAVQGQCPPAPFDHPALVIFAGDHGVARSAGTSAYPPEVTAQMVANFAHGGAAATVLANRLGVRVRVLDVSVDADPAYLDDIDPGIAAHRIRRGSGSVDREDAMTAQETDASLRLGRRAADEAIDAGADLLLPGDMGIGNTTPATAIIAAVTGTDPMAITGRGTGVDDTTLERKRRAIASAVARARESAGDPAATLAVIGAPDIAAMTGFLAQAAVRGCPVVLDGIVSSAAALLADQLEPGARAWWIASHRSAEPAAASALTQLELTPLLDLGLRLGEGTGALIALPLLDAASATLREMSTFADAGVSDRDA